MRREPEEGTRLYKIDRHPTSQELIWREFVIVRRTPRFFFVRPIVPNERAAASEISVSDELVDTPDNNSHRKTYFYSKADALSRAITGERGIIDSAVKQIERSTERLAELYRFGAAGER